MSPVIRYPSPFLNVQLEFKEKFGEYYASFAPNIVMSNDRVVGLVLVEFVIDNGKSTPVILRDNVTFEYLFTAIPILKGYRKYDSITVRGYYYKREYVINSLKILKRYGSREIDFWFLKHPEEKEPVLGLGNDSGFILIAPYMKRIEPSTTIEQFLKNKRRKYVFLNTNIGKDIDIPDHIIEKWIKELGLNL